MKRYSVLLGQDIPAYCTVIVEAESEAEANAKTLAMAKDPSADLIFEPNWEGMDEIRIADSAMEVAS